MAHAMESTSAGATAAEMAADDSKALDLAAPDAARQPLQSISNLPTERVRQGEDMSWVCYRMWLGMAWQSGIWICGFADVLQVY